MPARTKIALCLFIAGVSSACDSSPYAGNFLVILTVAQSSCDDMVESGEEKWTVRKPSVLSGDDRPTVVGPSLPDLGALTWNAGDRTLKTVFPLRGRAGSNDLMFKYESDFGSFLGAWELLGPVVDADGALLDSPCSATVDFDGNRL